MTESSTDRTLLTVFIVIAILAVIVYFTRGVATSIVRPVSTTTWRTSNPASAGTVVRAVSPVSSSRSRSYYSSSSSNTYTQTIPGESTSTTYYETY
jgi:hypothetical protein